MAVREVTWLIEFKDRIGIGLEIFQLLLAHHVNATAMEAGTTTGMVIRFQVDEQVYGHLREEMERIAGVTRVSVEERMPFEKREHELETILNIIDEGILAVDHAGRITHLNEVAAHLLYVDTNTVLGTLVGDSVAKDLPILRALKEGKSYRHVEIRRQLGKHTLHCIASGQPVVDKQGNILGAVSTFKGFDQFREIIHSVGSLSTMTTFRDIVYQSQKMKTALETANAAARTNASILLRGESGTGKEMFARAIHMASEYAMGPFVAVNCAALPENLLESELFGYEEGSFTGAMKGGKKGLFEEANGGTLFLDEIGEVSLAIQARLLRTLQEHTIRRVGGLREIPVNTRIVAATHQDLENMIRTGLFREDLYYRINVIPIRIPPLRERPEDIYPLVQSLLQHLQDKLHCPPVKMRREVMDTLARQPWPGNVRQLANVLERLVALIPSDEITLHDLQPWLDENTTQPAYRQINDASTSGFHLHLSFPHPWPSLKEVSQAAERQLICTVLTEYPSSRKAGNILGVSNTTVLNKIKELKINPQYCDPSDE